MSPFERYSLYLAVASVLIIPSLALLWRIAVRVTRTDGRLVTIERYLKEVAVRLQWLENRIQGVRSRRSRR